ncbi:hypothetical protein TRVA0_013S02960 [Trichomonascus vanleenenianus]|uniref:class I SAM-dependent methyltransferase n=1 Tax=Trichomonascus vanleenenianus TaxID=2268995 RepID=UPI003ECA31D8
MPVNTFSTGSYDKNHELYDKVRQNFVSDAVDTLVSEINLKEGSTVIELASGTGKFTKAIENRGYKLTACEPSKGMIASFKKNFPNIPCIQGDSYKLPFKDASADAILIAQAFHWFADTEAVAELGRVVKPGGYIGLIWNYESVDQLPSDHWQKQTTDYIYSHRGDVPQYHLQWWTKAFENQSVFETPYHEKHFHFQKKVAKDFLWPYWESRSFITSLPDEKKQAVQKELNEILEGAIRPGDVDQDGLLTAEKGTHIVWAKRL